VADVFGDDFGESGPQFRGVSGGVGGDRHVIEPPEGVLLWERFGGELTLILSAYNAGPHRADVWREFAEADDPLRFTERIPFRETRDYVKQVTRNQALYAALYGMGRQDGGTEEASPEAGSGDGRDGVEPRSDPGG
jgi:hypothetical protein